MLADCERARQRSLSFLCAGLCRLTSRVRIHSGSRASLIPVNCQVLFAFTGIHFVAIYSLDVWERDSARKMLGKFGRGGSPEPPASKAFVAPGQAIEVNRLYLRDGEQSQKIMTVSPTLTRSFTRAASQLARRMQPWLAARPIVSGLFVP